jgi:hypothetical protein
MASPMLRNAMRLGSRRSQTDYLTATNQECLCRRAVPRPMARIAKNVSNGRRDCFLVKRAPYLGKKHRNPAKPVGCQGTDALPWVQGEPHPIPPCLRLLGLIDLPRDPEQLQDAALARGRVRAEQLVELDADEEDDRGRVDVAAQDEEDGQTPGRGLEVGHVGHE